MAYLITTATQKLYKLDSRIKGIAGGTSAGKTIGILQILIDLAQTDTVPTLTSITSESMPHLKRGCIKDFLDIMQSANYFDDNRWNKTDATYTFPTGSRIEFFSLDMPHKVRGPRRERLFINEANNIPHETFDQLEVRTTEVIWLDWNPTNEFWFYTDIKDKRTDVDFLILTYVDNEGLDPKIVQSIEMRKDNLSWWQVYGLGLLGEVEGKIYTSWNIIDSVPHEAKLVSRGLDFGYTNDPTAIIDVYKYNGGFILDERLYQKGMGNKQIADFISNLENSQQTVYGDREMKSIDEIYSYGVNIRAAQKGPGSINQGIAYLQEQRVSMTKRSVNLIKEYRMYMWQTDKEGKILNDAIDLWNHALDAVRYAVETYSIHSRNEAAIVTSTPYGQQKANPFEIDKDGMAKGMYDIGRVVKHNAEWED